MKVVIVHGQSHKESTYHLAKMLADKIGGECTEFFLPRDFGAFCTGCANCILKSETLCPHAKQLAPITEALDSADVIILASPVYVYHVTGAMKAFLDHYAYRWMIHRPSKAMFRKQAVCISTCAGGGTKTTNRDMVDSLFNWGVTKIYRIGVAVYSTKYNGVSDKKCAVMEKKTAAVAKKIKKNYGKVRVGWKVKLSLSFYQMLHKKTGMEKDLNYWKEQGWGGKNHPWS